MNLDEYVQDAIRTESRIKQVVLSDAEVFYAALQIFILSGQILDKYKKSVFYGKDLGIDEIEVKLEKIEMLSEVGFNTLDEIAEWIDPRVFHALIGTATEATELMEALLKASEGEKIDYINILEEFGDINWYTAVGVDAMGGDFEKIFTTNIEKLRKRFPEKFTNENAIKRDLNEERNTLESGLTKIS